ncbi:MAG TPA: hypothetical protein VLK24_12835 [Gaiellaceae bacterium]|nr:hypothetical protein [Gaiellaceae bacterium]
MLVLVAAAWGAADFAAGVGHSSGWMRPSGEPSVFGWVCGSVVLIGAASLTSLAVRGRAGSRLLLATGLAYIAVDEVLGVHERLAGDLDARSLMPPGWAAAGLLLSVAVFAAVAYLLLRDAGPRGACRTLVVTGVALLVASIAARFAGGFLAAAHRLPAGASRSVGESVAHACGSVGWLLVAAGLLARTRVKLDAAAL